MLPPKRPGLKQNLAAKVLIKCHTTKLFCNKMLVCWENRCKMFAREKGTFCMFCILNLLFCQCVSEFLSRGKISNYPREKEIPPEEKIFCSCDNAIYVCSEIES